VRMSPLFWLLPNFAPNFHTHPTPEQKVGFQVSGAHPSSLNLGYGISGVHPNLAEKVGYRVSGVPRVQDPGPKSLPTLVTLCDTIYFILSLDS
jgi:hypothetical protein